MSLLFQHKTKSSPQVDNPYWMSFSDMMSGMLIIFILVCIALLYRLSQIEDTVANIRYSILYEIYNELNTQKIEVSISDNDSVLRIPADILHFKSGRYDIDKELEDNAVKVGRALARAIKKNERWKYLETVFIEGHTDSDDYKGIKGNWGLSTFRAITLWQLWTENKENKEEFGNDLLEFTNKEGKKLFSVSGYAATRPAVTEKNDNDKQQNRRIDIRFTTIQPTIMKMEDVVAPLKEK